MRKQFNTILDYHVNNPQVAVKTLNLEAGRISFLSEVSNHVKFASTQSNGVVLELSGTAQHLTRMDGILDESPTRPGDVCLMAPKLEAEFAWTIHGTRQHSVFVEFGSDIFRLYTPELDTDRLELGHLVPSNYAPRPKLEVLCRLLGREVLSRHPQGRMFTDLFMRLLAIEVAGAHWSHPKVSVGGVQSMDKRIHRAIEFIEAHFTTDISLLEISRASGLSPTQLTTLFTRHAGQTPYSYVIERRLQEAIHLLYSTDTPIAQIAPGVGFSDQQHMTRMFRSRLGRTPGALRKEKGPVNLPGPPKLR